MIFWKRNEADLQAGQQLLAKLMMQKDVQEKYSQTTGSIPVRTDIDLSGPAWSDGQREASAVADRGLQEQARAAQPRPQHGADQPDHGRDDRRAHRVRPQRQGDAPSRPRRGWPRPWTTRADEPAGPARGPGWRAWIGRSLPLAVIWLPLLINAAHVRAASRPGRRGSRSRRPTLLPEYGWAGLRNYRAVLRTENSQIAYINLLHLWRGLRRPDDGGRASCWRC